MGRISKAVYILALIVASAVIAFPFYYVLSYYFFPTLLSPVYEYERKGLIDFMSRRGYTVCGEVTLNYGEEVKTIFTKTFSGETKCLVFFNLPEPKSEYVVFQPVVEFILKPVREEDMDKQYRYHFVFAVPGAVIYEMVARPFIDVGKGVSSQVKYYQEMFKRGVKEDVFVLFSYKPIEDPEMPVNATIIVEATVLRHGEEYKPIIPPTYPRTGEEFIRIIKEVDYHLERLGYLKCGEYILDLGRHPLNLEFIFNPYEGRACYIKLLPRDLIKQEITVLGGSHSWNTIPAELDIDVAWIEETSLHFDPPYSLLLKADPAYERYKHGKVPEAFSEKYEVGGFAGSGLFGRFSNDAIYILFSLRVSPESKVEPRDFMLVYRISMEVEVAQKTRSR